MLQKYTNDKKIKTFGENMLIENIHLDLQKLLRYPGNQKGGIL